MKVINLFGAPGSGKSTTMLGLTYQMKMLGLSVESTVEFFKELVLEDGVNNKFGGQLYVLGEQNRRLARLKGKNDFAVTDCPLPLIGFYTKEDYVKGFRDFSTNLYNTYENLNYFILRTHGFEKEKRIHTKEESERIESDLQGYLKKQGIPFKAVSSSPMLVEHLLHDLMQSGHVTPSHVKNPGLSFPVLHPDRTSRHGVGRPVNSKKKQGK